MNLCHVLIQPLRVPRYAPRKGAAPILVSLWPAIRSFWMLQARVLIT